MKSLFINDKRLILSDNTYFPFTQTISDLENVNIIGIPSTKSITIPRCPQNDEIFGYIGELTRINMSSSDNKIGVSFNQTKKTTYNLYDESVLISTGIILIENITDNEYQISLYDSLIDKLEELDNTYLNDVSLISGDYLVEDEEWPTLSIRSAAYSIYNMSTTNNYIKPIITIDEKNDFIGTDIRCMGISGTTLQGVQTFELPQDCSPIQLKSVKNYDVNFATSIKNLINSINLSGDTIGYDSELDGLFTEVNVMTNKPKFVDSLTVSPTMVHTSASPSTFTGLVSGGHSYMVENGAKTIDLTVSYQYHTDEPTSMIGGAYNGSVWSDIHYGGEPTGTVFSKRWLKLSFTNNTLTTEPIYFELQAVKGINSVITFGGGGWADVVVTNSLTVDMDLFPFFQNTITTTYMNVELLDYGQEDPTLHYYFLTYDTAYFVEQNISVVTTETRNQFRTNDLLKSENILPKLTIKSFILGVAKFFNLDLYASNNVIKFRKKNYYQTNENLIVDSITNINTSNINFSKLSITSELPSSEILTNYKNRYKQTYGEQIINTGYSIKNNTKEIKLDVSVPFSLKDYNSFAYERYCGYFNGGYSKVNYGVTTGFDSKLVFGYINQITGDTIYITNDSPYEGKMVEGTLTGATDVEFINYNPCLYNRVNYIDSKAGKYYFSGTTNSGYNPYRLTSYYTFVPYVFSGSTITKSLEVNKSLVNYANIADANYPDESTLYYRFHRNMLVDKYDSNTHILKIKLYIDGPVDVYKIYNYQNSNYIISKIVEYDPTTPGIYEFELMKVNNVTNYTNNIIL